jgi:tRNA (guanine37-N1)-methyltransferase
MASTACPNVAEIDRAAFASREECLALRVPKQHCGEYMKNFKPYLLNMPRMRSIVDDTAGPGGTKLILVRRDLRSIEELPADARAFLAARDPAPEPVQHSVTVDYSYFSMDGALKKLLPEGMEIPSSFETIGHIAHLNLRDEQLPHKHLIAQVLLDKNHPRIRTVLNKVGTITNEFRVFAHEVLAGPHELDVTVKESGCNFSFNFGKVYWNSRLQREHTRLVDSLSSTHRVADMMAGVGPFAIPLGRNRKATVLANDLNPDSHAALVRNISLNKVSDKVTAYNLCGREFVRQLAAEFAKVEAAPEVSGGAAAGAVGGGKAGPAGPGSGSLAARKSQGRGPFDRALMNLPASAPEFTDAFIGLARIGLDGGAGSEDAAGHWTEEHLPWVHCYCFAKGPDAAACHTEVAERLDRAMQGLSGLAANPERLKLHDVRDVAPSKRMFCASFQLPKAVAFATPPPPPSAAAAAAAAEAEAAEEEPASKRLRPG